MFRTEYLSGDMKILFTGGENILFVNKDQKSSRLKLPAMSMKGKMNMVGSSDYVFEVSLKSNGDIKVDGRDISSVDISFESGATGSTFQAKVRTVQ